jgi:DNA-binding NarL/FixJ family response regulator
MATGIIIFEDNTALRESLENLLQLSGLYEVMAAKPDANNAEALVLAYQPGVVLMDIDMPGVTGVDAVKAIRAVDKNVQIIMLTVFDDHEHVFDALSAGANGYLLKKYISEKLLSAISEVLEGGAPMSPSVARMIIDKMQLQSSPAKNYKLTAREKEVLQLLADGNSFKMIAAAINLSLDTVRTHIKHIYDKLHVHSQVEAVRKGLHERIVK